MAKTRRISGRKRMSRKVRKIRKGTRRYRGGDAGLQIRIPAMNTPKENGLAAAKELSRFLEKCVDPGDAKVGCKSGGKAYIYLDVRALNKEAFLSGSTSLKTYLQKKQNVNTLGKKLARGLSGTLSDFNEVRGLIEEIEDVFSVNPENIIQNNNNNNSPAYIQVESIRVIPTHRPLPIGYPWPSYTCDKILQLHNRVKKIVSELSLNSTPVSSPTGSPRSSHSKIRNLLEKAPSSA